MTAGRWERVKVAFESARTLSAADRQECLHVPTASDPEIAEEIHGLLAAYGESESFLATAGCALLEIRQGPVQIASRNLHVTQEAGPSAARRRFGRQPLQVAAE
jgi:hypothetical protein